MLSKPVITSPVIGVSKIQLEQLIAATKITLSDDDIAYLEELYHPSRTSGRRETAQRYGELAALRDDAYLSLRVRLLISPGIIIAVSSDAPRRSPKEKRSASSTARRI